jgi:hypothetical protein
MRIRWQLLAAAIATACVVCFWIGFRIGVHFPEEADVPARPTPVYHLQGRPIPDPAPLPNTRQSDPRMPEPRAIEARASAISRNAAAIQAECRQAAAGDWVKWQQDTASYRATLKGKIDVLKEFPRSRSDAPEGQVEPLEGREEFPLFEVNPRVYLNYLYDPGTLQEFRRNQLVVAAHRWLRERGIDLFFVPVPKMTEVYIEHFLDPCPPDGIIAPHVRQTLLELLQSDVEVVDGFPLFRGLRDSDAEYLYNTADPHWAPRGMRIMAKEIASRIERYRFGARARYGLPIVRSSPAGYVFDDRPGGIGSIRGWRSLSPDQSKRAERVQSRVQAQVLMQDGDLPDDDPSSPVVLIGHSYLRDFREQLIKELNLLLQTRTGGGNTTEAFADFLREPELLAHARVVVWITTEQHMTQFAPLPAAIMASLKEAN